MRIPARHLTCVAPARTEGLLALCALDPVGGDRCQAIGATLIASVITVP